VGEFVRRLLLGLVLGITFGFAIGFSVALTTRPRIGVVLGVLAVTVGLTFGLIDGLNIWIDAPADVALAVDPDLVLEADRTASLARAAVVTLAVAVGVGIATTPGLGWMKAVELALIMALMYGLADRLAGVTATAWGKFVVARAGLAASNRLPWRLMAFLDDAHRRGVLRQAGAIYQFRHARLQERLASDAEARARG
jgi:hypothetical protein